MAHQVALTCEEMAPFATSVRRYDSADSGRAGRWPRHTQTRGEIVPWPRTCGEIDQRAALMRGEIAPSPPSCGACDPVSSRCASPPAADTRGDGPAGRGHAGDVSLDYITGDGVFLDNVQ